MQCGMAPTGIVLYISEQIAERFHPLRFTGAECFPRLLFEISFVVVLAMPLAAFSCFPVLLSRGDVAFTMR